MRSEQKARSDHRGQTFVYPHRPALLVTEVRGGRLVVVQVDPVLEALVGRGCRFVVVGSAARGLLGESVCPADLDVVVWDQVDNRSRVTSALIDVAALVDHPFGRRPLTNATRLPWEWGWRATTTCGPVDVVTRFVDGTGYADHDCDAIDVMLSSRFSVRCHPTNVAK